MPHRRVLIAHPDITARKELSSLLANKRVEVVTVESVEQLVDVVDSTFDGAIVACCFGEYECDGLAVASLLRNKQLGSFDGFVLGVSCSGPHFRNLQNHGMTSSDDIGFIARVMVHELTQQLS